MDVGFIRAGMKIVYANEINRHASDTYRYNLGDHLSESDIYDELATMSRFSGVDCVFGGPPCQ